LEHLVAPWEIRRETLVRIEAETDWRYGVNPHERPLEKHIRYGVINLDKHRGPTSHEVAATLKNILGISHAGHGGTLEEVFYPYPLGIPRRKRSPAHDAGGGYEMRPRRYAKR